MLERIVLAIAVTLSVYLSVESSWLNTTPKSPIVQQSSVPEPAPGDLL